jgi:phosphoribosylaminoimidazolecarboxamide formyltransferase/IMP cyclohydrolase
MGTDVSSFKNAYKTAIESNFPETAILIMGMNEFIPMKKVPIKLRYGSNPHQPFAAYYPVNNPYLSVGNLDMLKGGKEGLSLTNLQDISQALNTLKYFPDPACILMKHLNPCGFKGGSEEDSLGFKLKTDEAESLASLYRTAKNCDPRSAFGSVVGFNAKVDKQTAEEIMTLFTEVVVAPDYEPEALGILMRNEGTKKLNNAIRVAKVANIDKIPKFIGDSVKGFYNVRNLVDGTLTFEIPYLTRIRSVDDFVKDPMIPNSDPLNTKPENNFGKNYEVMTQPTEQQLKDCLTSWYININVRSNGVVFVKDGAALAVGTGEQERVGAVEKAIEKAIKKGHTLEGSVMSSDGFFPQRDCIDAAAKEGVRAIVWPAGSMNDSLVIEAANEHKVALIATLERCFAHH